MKKEALAQVLSCEFCVIFQKGLYAEHLRWTALITFWGESTSGLRRCNRIGRFLVQMQLDAQPGSETHPR